MKLITLSCPGCATWLVTLQARQTLPFLPPSDRHNQTTKFVLNHLYTSVNKGVPTIQMGYTPIACACVLCNWTGTETIISLIKSPLEWSAIAHRYEHQLALLHPKTATSTPTTKEYDDARATHKSRRTGRQWELLAHTPTKGPGNEENS